MRTLLILALGILPVMADEAAPPTPRKSPEFVINLPDGTQKLLSSYRGKVCLIEFLYTTCPHCQAASRLISKLNNEYGAKGLQPIGVGFDPMAKMNVPDFIRDNKVNFPVGFAAREPVLGCRCANCGLPRRGRSASASSSNKTGQRSVAGVGLGLEDLSTPSKP